MFEHTSQDAFFAELSDLAAKYGYYKVVINKSGSFDDDFVYLAITLIKNIKTVDENS